MYGDILHLMLIGSVVTLGFLAVQLPDLLHAIIALCGCYIAIGAIFWMLDAPYVALFQILVYAGAVVVLFVAAVMLTSRR